MAPDELRDQSVEVEIGYKQPDGEPGKFVKVCLNQTIKLVQLQQANFIRFYVGDNDNRSKDTALHPLNQVLIDAARRRVWPKMKEHSESNKNEELFNNIIETFETLKVKAFSQCNVETTGKSFVSYVTRLIWYLDP